MQAQAVLDRQQWLFPALGFSQLLPAALSHGCIWGARSSRHRQCFRC